MLRRRSKRGHEPEDGGYHRILSDSLGELRAVDCFEVITWNVVAVLINLFYRRRVPSLPHKQKPN